MQGLLVWLLGCSLPSSPEEAPPAPEVVHASVDFDDPTTCAACHGKVVEEWRTSMHASAHHERDPIYGAMRTLRMTKQGEEVGGQCLTCHTPRSPTDPTTPAALQGVSCATCHAATAVNSTLGPGAKALTFSPDTLRGARDVAPGASPVHGTGPAAPHLADGTTMCLACHDATTTPSGAAACTTGPEYAQAGPGPTCVQCHMPRVDGASGVVSTQADHASHAFLGPHAAWAGDGAFLASSVGLSATLADGAATVSLVNQTGHAFPTGFPGRMASVVVRGFDAAGAEVWTSLGADGAPTPDAVLNKVYVDADGKPVPSPFAESLARDSRLKPGETRAMGFAVPGSVVRVEAQLRFHLMAPKLAETLGLGETAEAKPVAVGSATATR